MTLLLVQVPYALAFLNSAPDVVFSGLLLNIEDSNQYLAAVRQGVEGSWLFYDRYTTETHQSGPLYLFYTGLGQAARALALSQHAIVHLARLAGGGALLATSYWFLSLVLRQRQQRRTAFLLLCFASGLGWLTMLVTQNWVAADPRPIDLWLAEANTFFALLHFPHFVVAMTLMLTTMGGTLKAFHNGGWAPALGAALACFALTWIHPFSLPVVYSTIVAYAIWQMAQKRRILWGYVRQVALCLVPSFLAVLYLWFGVIQPNPAFRGWVEQSGTPSPGPLLCVLGYGLLLPLALIGVWKSLRGESQIDPLPLCWLATAALLLYAPIAFQRRFLEGLHIPLCILAASGWQAVSTALAKHRIAGPLVRASLIVGLVCSTALIWVSTSLIAVRVPYPSFVRSDEAEALSWLTNHGSSKDVVLASHVSGNFIPAWSSSRVVIDHWAQTIHLPEKRLAVEQFLDAETAPERRRALVDQYGVVYLFHGPNEREIGDYDPSDDPLWEPVFANEQVTIYRDTLGSP